MFCAVLLNIMQFWFAAQIAWSYQIQTTPYLDEFSLFVEKWFLWSICF